MGKNERYFRRASTTAGLVLFVAVLILSVQSNLAKEAGAAKTVEQKGPLIQADVAPEIFEYVPGRILVKFGPSVTVHRKLALLDQIGAKSVKAYPIPAGLELIALPKGVGVQQAREYFSRFLEVEYSEPDFVYADAVPENPSVIGLASSS